MKRTFLFILTLMAINIHASAINQTTYAYWDKPDVEIFYITPKKLIKIRNYYLLFMAIVEMLKIIFQHGFHISVIKILL